MNGARLCPVQNFISPGNVVELATVPRIAPLVAMVVHREPDSAGELAIELPNGAVTAVRLVHLAATLDASWVLVCECEVRREA
ncbi:MAG: hypothetical protein U0228_22220 [Myxococcaceae bacterium]